MQVAVQHRRWDPVPTLPGARTRCWTWITGQVLPPVRPTSEIPMFPLRTWPAACCSGKPTVTGHFAAGSRQWRNSAWAAWAAHHDTVWAAIAVDRFR